MQDHIGKTYTSSFTAKYNAPKLVYYKLYDTIEEAIAEEKESKDSTGLLRSNLYQLDIKTTFKSCFVKFVTAN
jgi:predicted GIY-YIG superfamily endonuclease